MAIRTANAVTREVPEATGSSLGRLAKCSEKNSERDTHRLTQNVGLTLPIPLSPLKLDCGEISFLKGTDWASFVMRYNLWHNLCGLKKPDHDRCRAIWSQFWDLYKQIDPGHEIYSREGHDFSRTAAVVLHGDEGRTLKKSAIMVVSIHSILGHGMNTCKMKEEYISMKLNYVQSTWTTRWLLAVLPRALYKEDDGEEIDVLQDLFAAIADDLRVLYEDGVQGRDGNTFYFCPVKIMGDWPFMAKCGCLGRSFMNVAKHKSSSKESKGICHRCKAGLEGFLWEDVLNSKPAWKASINTLDPFTRIPTVLRLPHDTNDPASFFSWDLFHGWHIGLAKNFLASAIVAYATSALFSGGIETRLEIVSNHYKAWCDLKGIKPLIKGFSKDNLSWKTTTCYPNGTWSKGAISTQLMRWFVYELRQTANDAVDCELLTIIREAAENMHQFLSGLYKQECWIASEKALELASFGNKFLRKYGEAVRLCFREKRTLFSLMPNLHRVAHIVDDLETQASSTNFALSPLAYSCQAEEDFVGRPSRISRRVSAKKVVMRTLQRSLQTAYSQYVKAGLLTP